MKYQTEQEEFWAGDFGKEYINRNINELYLASNLAFFTKALSSAEKINSIIEFGANVGMNLKAIKKLLPEIEVEGVEINELAAESLSKEIGEQNVHRKSILEFISERKHDLVLIKGVLIHINPDALQLVYEKLNNSTSKYILICEYYNPSPISINYRGYKNKLFKRDFAGEFLDKYSEYALVDYGFVYHRDNLFPQDDITWFLLKKS